MQINMLYLLWSMPTLCHAPILLGGVLCRMAADLLISTILETKSHRNYICYNCVIVAMLFKYKK